MIKAQYFGNFLFWQFFRTNYLTFLNNKITFIYIDPELFISLMKFNSINKKFFTN